MKIFELSKELNVTNKEMITFFKDHGYSVSSHMQIVSDDMAEFARCKLRPYKTDETTKDPNTNISKVSVEPIKRSTKVFKADDEIICKSVTPWKLTAVGVDKNTVYHWEYFGDIDYVKYRDLQALRRTEYIMKPNIIIMDDDLRNQWSRELGDVYKYFDGINYPEEYFDKSDDEFSDILKNAPSFVVDVIKTTAITMIRNENYPSILKVKLIDDITGTCIKDFL